MLESLNLIPDLSKLIIVLELTLAEVPPPTKYLTVKVVLLGAVP